MNLLLHTFRKGFGNNLKNTFAFSSSKLEEELLGFQKKIDKMDKSKALNEGQVVEVKSIKKKLFQR